MNYILNFDVPFEMVTIRYGKQSCTSTVRITQAQVFRRMPGKGPGSSEPITGRRGGQFYTFGDYSVNLFEKSKMYGDISARPFFEQAAVAIIKNPDWAECYEHPAPIFTDRQWVVRPDNERKIIIWEWFDIYGIIYDFFRTMDNFVIAEKP